MACSPRNTPPTAAGAAQAPARIGTRRPTIAAAVVSTTTRAAADVDNDGRWTWKGSAGPAPGEAWVVRYRAPAVYVVFTSLPRFRSEADEPMPQLVTLKRLDKVSHEDLRT